VKIEYRATFTDGKHANLIVEAGSVHGGFFKALGVINRDYPRKELAAIAFERAVADVSYRGRQRSARRD